MYSPSDMPISSLQEGRETCRPASAFLKEGERKTEVVGRGGCSAGSAQAGDSWGGERASGRGLGGRQETVREQPTPSRCCAESLGPAPGSPRALCHWERGQNGIPSFPHLSNGGKNDSIGQCLRTHGADGTMLAFPASELVSGVRAPGRPRRGDSQSCLRCGRREGRQLAS